MSTIELIREQIRVAHDWFEGTMADVTPEMAAWTPGGQAHPIGSRYAHMVVSEDMLIHVILQAAAPVYAGAYAGKTGLKEPEKAFHVSLEWARQVEVDLEAMREYARAVYAATEAHLSSLSDEDLDRTIDLSDYGMGEWRLGAFLMSFIFAHIHDIMGEVSALKGVQGAQGYPF